MGLIRLHHGSWENHRVSRCTQAHTHMLNRISWMETITFTYTVCTRINQQTPLGCRSQECFSLSKRKKKKMIVGGLKQPEPQLVWIPVGAPGSPRKYQILHWGCGGWTWVSAQRSHRYACRVRCFLRRGGTVSFQPLKEKQTPPWKVE